MLLARSDVVKLNVGGYIYSTTRSSISKYPGLAGILSGKIPTTQDDQGHHFIDRNGKLFEHILQFVRTGKVVLPDDFKELEGLCLEANFYQITEFKSALKAYTDSKRWPASSYSDEVMICWLLGHDKKNSSICHYQIYCKSGFESFKLQSDYTFGGKLTLQTFHNYLEKADEWRLVKSETMEESHAAAFFLSAGFQQSPFKKELNYTNVKVEMWKKACLL